MARKKDEIKELGGLLGMAALAAATRRSGQSSGLLDMLANARLSGVAVMGPDGLQFIGDEDDDDDDEKKGRIDSVVGRGLSHMDLGDYVPKTEVNLVRLPTDHPFWVTAVRFRSGPGESDDHDRDVHLVALIRDEHDERDWQLVSYCPEGMHSVCTPFHGDEEHAGRVLRFMVDFFAGGMSSSDIAREMTDRVMAWRERQRAAREQRQD